VSKHFYLGIDGGASSCKARLCDVDGALLGEGSSGPANAYLDMDLACQSVVLACRAALRAAGVSEDMLRRTHAGLGLAGIGMKDRHCLLGRLDLFASLEITSDADIALLGAHREADGGIVILGTGSCGLGLVRGRRIEVGGWGAEISDEAGGARMGRELLRRTLWAFDGRVELTALSALVLDRFQHDPRKIVTFAANATPAQYGQFAPLVFAYASRNDLLAMHLVQEAAEAAGRIIARLAKGGALPISLLGGLAEPLAPWLDALWRKTLRPPQSDALDGAILLARVAAQDETKARSSAA
jgi:glucosamine kinase